MAGAAVAVAQIVPLEEGCAASVNESNGGGGVEGVGASRRFHPSWRSYLPNLLVDCSKQVCAKYIICQNCWWLTLSAKLAGRPSLSAKLAGGLCSKQVCVAIRGG